MKATRLPLPAHKASEGPDDSRARFLAVQSVFASKSIDTEAGI